MNKAYLTILLCGLFQTINANSSTSYTCINHEAEVAIHINVYDEKANNNFIIDSPQFELLSKSGKGLSICELHGNYLVQAISQANENMFVQITVPALASQDPSVIQRNFTAQVTVHNNRTKVHYALECQAITAKD